MGFPLQGDGAYGAGGGALFLHCWQMELLAYPGPANEDRMGQADRNLWISWCVFSLFRFEFKVELS